MPELEGTRERISKVIGLRQYLRLSTKASHFREQSYNRSICAIFYRALENELVDNVARGAAKASGRCM